MSLYEKLLNPDLFRLLPESFQHLDQTIIYTTGQIGQQSRTQSHPLNLGIFFSFPTSLVQFSLAHGHTENGIQDLFQRLVLTHQCIPSRNQNIPQLRIMLVIHHQALHLDFPPVCRFQPIQVKIQMSFLEVVHPLA